MLVLRHRLAIAGVIAAAAVTVPAAALASGSDSLPGQPTPSQACAVSACKSKAGHAAAIASAAPSQLAALAALAATAGISTDRLQAGLAAAKRADGNTAAGIAAFAASAGVSQATAQRIVHAVFGTQVDRGKAGEPAITAALASQLSVSISAAQRAVNQLDAVGEGGVDPASPVFATIAGDLGVSPARLAAALDAVKQSEAGK